MVWRLKRMSCAKCKEQRQKIKKAAVDTKDKITTAVARALPRRKG
jgi:hypothetical protein